MVSTSPSLSMTIPDPSRSRPKPATVRPSGLMWVLIRTTAETSSSTQASCAAAEPPTSAAKVAVSRSFDQDSLDQDATEPRRRALRMNAPVRRALLSEEHFYPRGTSIRRAPPSRRFRRIRKSTRSGDGTLATPAALLGNCHARALVKLAINPPVDLDLVERKRLQVRQRRIPRSEVVHGDADAEILKSPLTSASGLNSPGGTMPCLGCFQRTNGSKPSTSPPTQALRRPSVQLRSVLLLIELVRRHLLRGAVTRLKRKAA